MSLQHLTRHAPTLLLLPVLALLLLPVAVIPFAWGLCWLGFLLLVWPMGLVTGHRQYLALFLALLVMLVGLLLPGRFVDSDELVDSLPVYLSLVGLDLEPVAGSSPAQHQVSLGASLGQAPESARRHVVLPWISDRNSPTRLSINCQPASSAQGSDSPSSCKAQVELGSGRKDYFVRATLDEPEGNNPSSSARTWGVVQLQSGDTLRLSGESGAHTRDLTITEPKDRPRYWVLGGCQVEKPSAGGVTRVALLDIYYTSFQDGTCKLRHVTDTDRKEMRWVSRAVEGGWDIGAYSFLELRSSGLRLVALDDPHLNVSLYPAGTAPPAPAAPSRSPATLASPRIDTEQDTRYFPPDRMETSPLAFSSGDSLRLDFLLRRFTLVELSPESESRCARSWNLGDCRRLTVSLTQHGLDLRIRDDARLFIEPHGRDLSSRKGMALTLLPDDLLLPSSQGGFSGEPRTFLLAQGNQKARTMFRQAYQNEATPLLFPFRLEGGTPYAATMDFSREKGVATLHVADSLRKVSFNAGERFSLGSADRITMEFEVARDPTAWLRIVLSPWIFAALLVAGSVLVTGAWKHPRAALFREIPTGGALLLLALLLLGSFATLFKAMVSFGVFSLPPGDWKAFDQLTLSTLLLPLALLAAWLAGACLGRMRRFKDPAGPSTSSRLSPWLLGLFVILALVRLFALWGREQLGSLRLVIAIPIFITLYVALLVFPPESIARQVRRSALARLVYSTVLAGLALSGWWMDKGALILLLFPLLAAWTWLLTTDRHAAVVRQRESSSRRKLTVLVALVALGAGMVLLFPGLASSLVFDPPERLLGYSPDPQQTCHDPENSSSFLANQCRTSVADPDEDGLEILEADGLLVSRGNPRHKIRIADWLNDHGPEDECKAAARLPTREGLEVGFYRQVSRRFLASSSEERRYFRPDLLDYPSTVVDPLLNDYLPSTTLVPQFPAFTISALAMGWTCLWAGLVLLKLRTAPEEPPDSASRFLWVAGMANLFLPVTGTVLGLATALDLYPNFAQSIPLLAIRSHSAWLLDALSLSMALFLLSAYHEQRKEPGTQPISPGGEQLGGEP